MRIGHRVLVLSLFVFATAGCSQERPKPEGFPQLVSGRITVVQDGRPLDNAVVRLHPEGNTKDWGTLGVTNASGVATLVTSSYWSGAPLGTYRVTVAKTVTEQSTLVEPSISDADAYQRWEAAKAGERLATHSLVDVRFGDPSRTPLSLTVTGAFTETVDVGSAVKAVVQLEN
jgi:hypothetical protein